MKVIHSIPQKIHTLKTLLPTIATWRLKSGTIAFTNGCFDILHSGHIASLQQAAEEADYLIVGVNADASVKRLKGNERPVNNQDSRSNLLANLQVVDAVIIFEEDTPLQLIQAIMPDVLVKGGDYTIEQIVGAKEVTANGGRVVINPIVQGFSTTGIIQTIQQLG
ncbi:MAG TPA: D-glycero-beta-D-manno-heptose 1-phosphate adenylyltransferase [Chitinophagaceae bacterium]|nr:D-glycero-beta-D-manno-heptose 1-phosphate adenylyltransferase [Chitinophagaceae bacterium]HAN39587.1 D-glycero-beta-D-manno-heptose 1-phosphate adenylyltransferase [Chitinophagaceae bacterium]